MKGVVRHGSDVMALPVVLLRAHAVCRRLVTSILSIVLVAIL